MAGIFCNISVLHLFHLKGPSKYLVPIKTNGDRIVAKVGSEIAAKVYPKKAFINTPYKPEKSRTPECSLNEIEI